MARVKSIFLLIFLFLYPHAINPADYIAAPHGVSSILQDLSGVQSSALNTNNDETNRMVDGMADLIEAMFDSPYTQVLAEEMRTDKYKKMLAEAVEKMRNDPRRKKDKPQSPGIIIGNELWSISIIRKKNNNKVVIKFVLGEVYTIGPLSDAMLEVCLASLSAQIFRGSGKTVAERKRIAEMIYTFILSLRGEDRSVQKKLPSLTIARAKNTST